MAITVWVSALILGSLLTCAFLVFSTASQTPLAAFPLAPPPPSGPLPSNATSPAEPPADPAVEVVPPPAQPVSSPAPAAPEPPSPSPEAPREAALEPTSLAPGHLGVWPSNVTTDRTDERQPLGHSPSTAGLSRALSDAALAWLAASNGSSGVLQRLAARHPTGIVVDYGARSSSDPLPRRAPGNWTWLTAPLDPDEAAAPDPWPDHQMLWAPPTAHRFLALAATMNFFTLQLLVRLGELLALPAMKNLSLPDLLGNVLGMASHTLLLLPCDVAVGDEAQYVRSALAAVTARRYMVGLRQLSVTIEALERFSHGGCQRSLLHVAVVSMLRGVRHYWCFHTARFKHKFDLKVKVVNGETTLMVLKRLVDKRNSRNLAHSFIPSINFAELLGWGLERSLRRLLLFDMLRFANNPDPFPQNWLLVAGARALRIDTVQGKNRIPPAQYLAVLRTMLCLNGPLDTGPPECATPCRACLHFRFVTRAVPPEACQLCADCVRRDVLRARPFLSGEDWAPDCDQVVNASDIQVGRDEHRCYPFTALTVHSRDLLSPDTA